MFGLVHRQSASAGFRRTAQEEQREIVGLLTPRCSFAKEHAGDTHFVVDGPRGLHGFQ